MSKARNFLLQRETLLQAFSSVSQLSSAQTLASFMPDGLSEIATSDEVRQFLGRTVVVRHEDLIPYEDQFKQKSLHQVLQSNIINLFKHKKHYFVQALGLSLVDNQHSLSISSLNLARGHLQHPAFSFLLNSLGRRVLDLLLYQYMIFVDLAEYYVQVCGPPLTDCFSKLAQKKVIRAKRHDLSNVKISRFQMLYCTHQSRVPGVFHCHPLFSDKIKNPCFFYKFVLNRSVERVVPSVENGGSRLINIAQQQLRSLVSQQQFQQLLRIYLQMVCRFKQLMNKQSSSRIRTNRFTAILAQKVRLPQKYKELKQEVQAILQAKLPFKETTFDTLYETNCSYQSVASLLQEVVRLVVPFQLLGSKLKLKINQLLFLLVSKKRFQSIRTDEFVHDLDIFDLPWACVRGHFNQSKSHYIRSRYRYVMGCMIAYIINQIVTPVIRFNFYVTERHKQNNKLFYYRKEVWTLISKLALKKFCSQNLALYEGHFSPNQHRPIGKLRIMPKAGSFRPIITFNKKIKTNSGKLYNLNQMLQDSRLVLRILKSSLAGEGLCVFDNDQIFLRLNEFTRRWVEKGKPSLTFFTMDIKKCYDSIDSQLLTKVIQSTPLLNNFFIINRYSQVYRNKKPLHQPSVAFKLISDYFNSRERFCASPLAKSLKKPFAQKQSLRPVILIPSGKTRSISGEEVKNRLISVCCGTTVIQYGRFKFKQVRGIPQGLNVSGVLCSLYFNFIERRVMNLLKHNTSLSLMMRLTDDFMFLGESAQLARQVIQLLQRQAEQFKFQFNVAKMLSNLQEKIECFTWIGKSININTLEVLPAFDKDLRKLYYSMNVNISPRSVKGLLKNKLKSLLMNHFASGFESSLFERRVLLRNIQVLVYVSLAKFFPFIDQISRIKLKDGLKILRHVFSVTFHQFVLFSCFLWKDQTQVSELLYDQLMDTLLQESYGLMRRVGCNAVRVGLCRYFRNRLRKRGLMQDQ